MGDIGNEKELSQKETLQDSGENNPQEPSVSSGESSQSADQRSVMNSGGHNANDPETPDSGDTTPTDKDHSQEDNSAGESKKEEVNNGNKDPASVDEDPLNETSAPEKEEPAPDASHSDTPIKPVHDEETEHTKQSLAGQITREKQKEIDASDSGEMGSARGDQEEKIPEEQVASGKEKSEEKISEKEISAAGLEGEEQPEIQEPVAEDKENAKDTPESPEEKADTPVDEEAVTGKTELPDVSGEETPERPEAEAGEKYEENSGETELPATGKEGDEKTEKQEPVAEDKESAKDTPESTEEKTDIPVAEEVTDSTGKGEEEKEGTEEGMHYDDAGEEEQEEENEEEDEEEKDYSTFSKEEIIGELEKILHDENIRNVERKVRALKPFYDDIYETERKKTLKKFLEEGEAEVDFQYAGDALDKRYETLYEKYKERRNNFYSGLEKQKDENLQKKHDVLEKLRDLVEGEETTTSIGALKEIQNEWKSIGPVPGQFAKSLWASYNALIDRFYDNRSIYFELKELDRKKNLEAKLELCEKAEELSTYENIRDAVKELNELHNEFKHIGPIPKDIQEEVWQRFKSASDAIYARRKEYVNELKKDLHENLDVKKQLVDEVKAFTGFDSDKISEWNEKTREILEVQKKWEKVGGLPREHARDVNKSFWSNFKTFFGNKSKFFKKLEGQRDENLQKKEELIVKAEEAKESEDWENTANLLKDLQKEWKNIGPVPEKMKNDVYKRFKEACDYFFDRRRAHSKNVEEDYRENLKKKESICDEMEAMTAEGSTEIDRFKQLQVTFDSIGYVPRNTIRKIQRRYENVVERFLSAVEIPDSEKSELKFTAEINRLKSSPNPDRRIQRKENELRRMINKIENDIALWKNNMEFFAESKTADKLREEFNRKIQDASEQLDGLKEELKVLNKI